MPDDAADEALHIRHHFGRVAPGWCADCSEYVCVCKSATPLDDPLPIAPPVLDGGPSAP